MSSRRALRFLARLGFTTGLLASALPPLAARGPKPVLGPNFLIFDPSMPSQMIQKQIDVVYATPQHNEFGPPRNAILFLPGSYAVDCVIIKSPSSKPHAMSTVRMSVENREQPNSGERFLTESHLGVQALPFREDNRKEDPSRSRCLSHRSS